MTKKEPSQDLEPPAAAAEPVTAHGLPTLEGVGSVEAEKPAISDPFGRYRDLELLGRGGMGEVYRGWDPVLERPVALKLLHGDRGAGSDRLLEEARAQASVRHANVCQVYEAAEIEGRPCIVMELVGGEPLARAAATLGLDEKVAVVRDVAHALHAAHELGVIHRDIKPSNIMVERPGNGAVLTKVLDFGLSRRLPETQRTSSSDGGPAEEAAFGDLSVHGGVAGTPAYMAPEQVLGRTARLDQRTDVYALGGTLYELLTGRPPVESGSPSDILFRVLSETPRPPRAVEPSIPADLEAVALKCLRKDPGERYPTAEALAADLDAFFEGRPVAAFGGGLGYRARTFIRRRRAVAVLATASLLALSVLGGLLAVERRSSARQAAAAQRFGQESEHIKTILWKAQSLPLHDIRPEKELVRGRMQALEELMADLGRPALGPGRYALGRAHLALGETGPAREDLEAAWEAGYEAPEVAYSLALALARQYATALTRVGATARGDQLTAELHRIEGEYRDPARHWLQQCAGLSGEAPGLVAGLLALSEGRHEDAVERAREAAAEVPWLYEAKLLEAEVELAAAVHHYEKAEYEAAMAAAELGAAAAAAAATLAPSNPLCHLRVGQLHLEYVRAREALIQEWPEDAPAIALEAIDRALAVDQDLVEALLVRSDALEIAAVGAEMVDGDWRGPLDAAVRDAERARTLAPHDPATHHAIGRALATRGSFEGQHGIDPRETLRAAAESLSRAIETTPSEASLIHLGAVWRRIAAWELDHGGDPTPAFEQAEHRYREAAAANPRAAAAWSGLGFTQRGLARAMWKQGGDPSALLEEAAATYRQAIEVGPLNAIPYNNLGIVHTDLGLYLTAHGADPKPAFAAAQASFEGALELMPNYAFATNNLANVWVRRAAFDFEHGIDPRASVVRAEVLAERCKTLRSGYASPFYNLGIAHRIRAELALAEGGETGPDLAAADRAFAACLELRPGTAAVLIEQAKAQLLAARVALATGASAEAALARASELLGAAQKSNPRASDIPVANARADLLEARRQMAGGGAVEPILDRALRTVEGADRADVEAVLATAEIRLWRARWYEAQGRDSSHETAGGLAALDALASAALPPPRAAALTGCLHVVEAAAAGDAEEREARARRAVAELTAAISASSYLGREAGACRDEARALLSRATAVD